MFNWLDQPIRDFGTVYCTRGRVHIGRRYWNFSKYRPHQGAKEKARRVSQQRARCH